MMHIRQILFLVVQLFPNIDTRVLIRACAKLPGMNKHRICGYLSGLKRRQQIQIRTIVPHHYSVAY